jgi:hypothetical protein
MADIELIEAILHADTILSADTTQPPYSEYKFATALRTAVAQALADARSAYSAFQLAAGDQAGASARMTQARVRLGDLCRNAHSTIEAVPADTDAEEQEKIDALVSIGFTGGRLGNLGDRAHLLDVVDAILANNASLPAAYRVPAAITTRLTNWRAVNAANEVIARGGAREPLTAAKDAARTVLEKRISRVRLYISSCNDLGEYNPELARYDFQPKRDPGAAQPQPKPGAISGTPTWNAGARTLTVAALPEHARRLKAWRKIAGGEWEPCGLSDTTTVDAAETSPFIPGGVYEPAVSGFNSAGDGPRSVSVSWTAPL